MAEYEYAGPGPVTDPEGVIVHPGDVREFAEEPAWGPWRLLQPEAGVRPAGVTVTSSSVPVAVSPPAAGAAAPVTASALVQPKGM